MDPLDLLSGISLQDILTTFTSTEFILLNPNAQPVQNCSRPCRDATPSTTPGTGTVPGGGGTQPHEPVPSPPGGTTGTTTTAPKPVAHSCPRQTRTVRGIVDIRTKGLGLIERGRCSLDLHMGWNGCSVTAVVLPGDGSFSGLFSGIKYHVNIYSTGGLDDASTCTSCCDECCCVTFAVMVSVTGLLTSSQFFTSAFRVCGNGNWDEL